MFAKYPIVNPALLDGVASVIPCNVYESQALAAEIADRVIGAQGVALEELAPGGTVRVHEGSWRARTNRATPIPAGSAVNVVAIDGITLEVEPIEGAARDYRERH
jgi:membrane-bound ClpP family serine protease